MCPSGQATPFLFIRSVPLLARWPQVHSLRPRLRRPAPRGCRFPKLPLLCHTHHTKERKKKFFRPPHAPVQPTIPVRLFYLFTNLSLLRTNTRTLTGTKRQEKLLCAVYGCTLESSFSFLGSSPRPPLCVLLPLFFFFFFRNPMSMSIRRLLVWGHTNPRSGSSSTSAGTRVILSYPVYCFLISDCARQMKWIKKWII